MRISIFGKGGSGKTTISSSLVSYFNQRNKKVLAIDADLNVHMGKTLGMDSVCIEDKANDIWNYLEPDLTYQTNHGEIKRVPLIGTLPPNFNSQFLAWDDSFDFWKKYTTEKEQIRLLTLGTYGESEVGLSCYHTKLKILEAIYHRYLDTDEVVIMDATAGIDSVATSIYMVSDINIFVVEPTLKSVTVYQDFIERIKDQSSVVFVIGNKITKEEDKAFLKSQIGEDYILGYIPFNETLTFVEQGQIELFSKFVSEIEYPLSVIAAKMNQISKDWDGYQKKLFDLYRYGVTQSFNIRFSGDFLPFANPQFSYKQVLREKGEVL